MLYSYNKIYNTKIGVTRPPKWTAEDFVKTSKIISVGTKHNRSVKKISSLKCVMPQIFSGLCFGVNRCYLLQFNRWVLILSYIFSLTIVLITIFNMLFNCESLSVSHFVFKYSLLLEYSFIIVISLISSKNNMLGFFRDLNKFDEILKLSNDLKVIDNGYVCFFWVFGCLVFSIIEYILVYLYLYLFLTDAIYSFYFMMLTHDYEQVLFFILLRNIYLRLRILKGHVSKMFSVEGRRSNYRKKLNKVEALSSNTRLDITSLHRVYDLLHNCSDQLNSAMSIPMTIIILTAAITTTMLLKMMVNIVQLMSTNTNFAKATILHLVSRSLKYTVLVVMSCYYSSVTFTQVIAIRTILHDAINYFPLEKTERRKVKAFFQLTRENEFAYALGGVIKLNMTLPLSYLSLCATYLVISMQFSKFFDN